MKTIDILKLNKFKECFCKKYCNIRCTTQYNWELCMKHFIAKGEYEDN